MISKANTIHLINKSKPSLTCCGKEVRMVKSQTLLAKTECQECRTLHNTRGFYLNKTDTNITIENTAEVEVLKTKLENQLKTSDKKYSKLQIEYNGLLADKLSLEKNLEGEKPKYDFHPTEIAILKKHLTKRSEKLRNKLSIIDNLNNKLEDL